LKHTLTLMLLVLTPVVWAATCNEHIDASTPSSQFVVNPDGTVVDQTTGLMWMRCVLGQNWNGKTCLEPKPWFTHRNWATAMKDAGRIQYAGYDDWYLPSVDELLTIVEQRCEDPAINSEVFPNAPAAPHWTRESYSKNHDYAWRVNFKNGKDNADIKENPSYVARLVRGQFLGRNKPQVQKPSPLDVDMSSEALKLKRREHAKLWQDDIHDINNPDMVLLQNPSESMADFTRNSWGRVDWMEALTSGEIEPKTGRHSNEPMQVIDLDIIMKDTGDMPWVKFPHTQHTHWLACKNCHPEPFPYREGIVKFNMNDVLTGKYCGICHGKVAFSTMICDNCHSVAKDTAASVPGLDPTQPPVAQ
jgi:c(7)-type cytochrome triheme protein